MVVGGALVGDKFLPLGDGFVPLLAFRCEAASLQVFECLFVRSHQTGAGAGFDGHVADGHAFFHRQGADGRAGVFKHAAGAAADADFGTEGEDDVLGRDAGFQRAFDANFVGLRLLLEQRLRSQHHLDFRRPDAERERAKRAVGGGVGIATDDGHARLSEAVFRSNDVNDTLVPVLETEVGDAEFLGVLFELGNLGGGDGIDDGQAPRRGGGGVIDGAERQVRTADLDAPLAEAAEGLGRGDFVDQMQVDEEQRRGAFALGDDVVIPHLFDDCAGLRWHWRQRLLLQMWWRGCLSA